MTTPDATPETLPKVVFEDTDGNRFHLLLSAEVTAALEIPLAACTKCGAPLQVEPGELRFDEQLATIHGPAVCCACGKVAGEIAITI